jgi:hypothetical protein
MTAIVEANHPDLFTRRRRLVRRLRRIPRNLVRLLGRVLARGSAGRLKAPPERW